MKATCIILTACLACTSLFAADETRKIAKVNGAELEELALSVLLNKPENSAKKEAYAKLRDDLAAAQLLIGTSAVDDATRRQIEQRLSEANQREQDFKKSMAPEMRRVILNAIREISRGRFVAVLDDPGNEAIVFKDAELVDITYDIKEKLLAVPETEASPPRLDILQPVPPTPAR
jgi:hypothetical protein